MKTKITITILILSGIFPVSFSQITNVEKDLRTVNTDTITGWKKGGIFAVNLSQTSLKNWASGGQNSIAVNGIFSYFANLKQEKSAWDNSLDIGYGLLKQGSAGYRKTDDKIELNSKYGRKAFGNFYYAGLLNFRTQMQPGYNYINETASVKISDLFSPAYLLLALGLDYKPDAYFSAFLAPITAKFTFIADETLSEAGAFGVTPGANSRSELGGYLRMAYSKSDFKNEILKNVSFTTRLDLFSNYAHNPQNVDVSWETLIGFKVNKYIGVNFNTHLLYDDDIKVPVGDRTVGSKTQFKEIFGVGFSYKF
jgi:hypothetical protein